MIVHLAASLRDPQVDAAYLRKIIEIVHDRGGVLAHSWLEPALARYEEKIYVENWKPYVEGNINAVKRADIVIADVTHYSFSQGFLVAAALEYKKPILALSRDAVDDKIICAITNPLFTLERYNDANELAKITETFLVKNTIHTKDLRFNMFLTRPIYKYLENVMQETGKNKSEIIRELIKRQQAKTRK